MISQTARQRLVKETENRARRTVSSKIGLRKSAAADDSISGVRLPRRAPIVSVLAAVIKTCGECD